MFVLNNEIRFPVSAFSTAPPFWIWGTSTARSPILILSGCASLPASACASHPLLPSPVGLRLQAGSAARRAYRQAILQHRPDFSPVILIVPGASLLSYFDGVVNRCNCRPSMSTMLRSVGRLDVLSCTPFRSPFGPFTRGVSRRTFGTHCLPMSSAEPSPEILSAKMLGRPDGTSHRITKLHTETTRLPLDLWLQKSPSHSRVRSRMTGTSADFKCKSRCGNGISVPCRGKRATRSLTAKWQ